VSLLAPAPPPAQHAPDRVAFLAIGYYYRAWLAQKRGLGRNPRALAGIMSALTWADAERPFQGCGENHPKVEPGKDDYRCADNRRVEVLFFRPGDAPVDLAPTVSRGKKSYPLYDPQRYVFTPLRCPPPRFFGRVLGEGKHVFLIDVSSSMNSDGTGFRINRAKVGLVHALFGLAAQTAEGVAKHEFAVLAFSSKAEANPARGLPAVPLTVQRWNEGTMVPATWVNQVAAEDWVNGLTPGGGTCTYQGMKAALEVPGATHVYLLSDGHPTVDKQGNRSLSAAELQAEVAALVAAKTTHGKPRIVTFGFDGPNTPLGRFLVRLATTPNDYRQI